MKPLFHCLAWVAVNVLVPNHAGAAPVPDCKSGPSKTLPTPQDSEYDHYRNAKVKAVAGPRGNREFDNRERLLPGTARNEVYYEYDLGKDGFDGRGADRAVLLVLTGNDKRKVLESYYTRDHYGSFCRITY